MRLFIALDFNELKKELIDLQNNIDDSLAKLNKADTFHLTLKFLGKVSLDKAKEVIERLKKVEFKPFKLSLSEIGVFPKEDYVRVVWVGVKPTEGIIELQGEIEDVLEDFEFKKEFKFHPHITLARVKSVNDREGFTKNLKDIKVEDKKVEVKDFRLVKSTLTQKGPVYEDVEIFKLINSKKSNNNG